MHPELLGNTQFQKYYEKWENDPTSVVFLPVAEYFFKYGLLDKALNVVNNGLKAHPQMITARLLLSKILIKQEKLEDATEELQHILSIVPEQQTAKDLIEEVEQIKINGSNISNNASIASPWQTITMAKIHQSQGNSEEAVKIYKAILKKDPKNLEAKDGLSSLGEFL